MRAKAAGEARGALPRPRPRWAAGAPLLASALPVGSAGCAQSPSLAPPAAARGRDAVHLVADGGCRACVSPRPLWAAPRGLPVLSRLSVEVRRAPRVLTEGRYLPRAAQEPERPDASPARPPSAARPPPRPRGSPRLPRCGNAGPTGSASSWHFPQERAGTRRPSTGRRASRAQSRTRSLAEDVSALPGVGGPSHATVAARAWPACVCISRHAVRVRCGSPPGSCPFVLRWPRRPRAPPSALPATATRLPRASPRGRNTPSISSRAARSGGARVLVLGSLKNSGRLFLLIRSSYLCGRRASPSLSALGLWVAASLS